MVYFLDGNMFELKSQYLVNTINCVGAMGKGIALEFKNRYPEMFTEYKKQCEEGKIDIGLPFIWENTDLFDPVVIINLPTKMHWRDPSKLIFIQKGLNWLEEYFKDKPDVTINMPALGCGNGGLDWDTVKDMIYKQLHPLQATFYVYSPGGKFTNQWGT